MTIYERIRNLRIKKGMSQDDLALKIGFKCKSAISKIEHGERDINQSMIVKYAEALSTTPSYLLFGDEKEFDSSWVRIPVLGSVAAGSPIYADTDIEEYVQIPYDLAKTGEFKGLRIHGHSMEPKIEDNDIVIVRLQEEAEDGDIVIAMVGDEEATCKKFKKLDSGIMLIPLNQQFDPLVFTKTQIRETPVKIYGRVVQSIKRF